jgi:hypothetical protein
LCVLAAILACETAETVDRRKVSERLGKDAANESDLEVGSGRLVDYIGEVR